MPGKANHSKTTAARRPRSSIREAKVLETHRTTQPVSIEVSSAFIELLEKMRDFEYLIERGDYFKAAIIGGDIQLTLDRFDPRLYFPAMLSRFSELFYEHGEQLAEHVRDRQSFRWKSHLQFYQIDRETFVRGRRPK